ncbi:MAG TPA: DUF222 domain-containing protein, partial [Jatrophihabitans sp.]|nr:DUF222 domain-containing protein [Jatrophihabitans sp.]
MDLGQFAEAVAQLRAGVDALLTENLAGLDSASVVELLSEVEVQRRRLDAADTRLICESQSRWRAGDYGQASTTDLLTQSLRVSSRSARARVKRADELGPRRTVTGEPLPPLFPQVATALAAGAISAEHADTIRRQLAELDHIPGLDPAALDIAEKVLVEAAHHEQPKIVAMMGAQLRDRLDPDGREPREEELERHRDFNLADTANGWAKVTGNVSPELAAVLRAIFDELAAPQPAADGMPDDRTPAQRRHDALAEALGRLLRSGELRGAGGAPVTVLVRVDHRDFCAAAGTGHGVPPEPESSGDFTDAMRAARHQPARSGPTGWGPTGGPAPRGGYATLGDGGMLPLTRLMFEACEAEMATIVTNDTGAVLALGRTRRLATHKQRLALAARDGGCSFPGCTRPAAWCEA